MSLTRRFFAWNVMTVLVSIGLTALAVMIAAAAYTKIFNRDAYALNMEKVLAVRTGMNELKREAQGLQFGQLLDKSFQQELSIRVKALGAQAILLQNRKVLFSTKEFNDFEIEKNLMLTSGSSHGDTIEIDGQTFMFERVSYKLQSGDDGTLLLLAPVRLNMQGFGMLALFTVCFFILVFLWMNLWVSYKFSRSILTPVSRLKKAAVAISEGDLSGEIAEEGDGEVRELGRTLELMRLKLKESIYLQQKYDENRKFLVSSISHDLKTPVTSIKGYIEGILDGVAHTPGKMQEYLETARSKAVLVNTMIDDLLFYSTLDLNQLPFHFERTDLAQYFEDCVADCRYEYDKANIALELVNRLEEPVTVLIDRERLMRVIQNILDNAAKYLDKPDGRVAIILRETRTSAIIEIADNGPGIPEKDLPHIFDRFYRVDVSRQTANGSGLGLAIAKQIVEGHDGKIWAKSAAGEGTRMMISLKKV